MEPLPADLARHPDRLRWNARYAGRPGVSFQPHPLAVQALALGLPAGPVLDLACGPSGTALLAAERGRRVTAVDISDTALRLLGDEARRRGLPGLITLVQADLGTWRPAPGRHALVLCTGFWDAAVFGAAVTALAPGGLLGWEAFTLAARQARPSLPAAWCLAPGEPVALLPPGFEVLIEQDLADGGHGSRRRLLARRSPEATNDVTMTSYGWT